MNTSAHLRVIAASLRRLEPRIAADLDCLATKVARMEHSLDAICEDAQEQDAIDVAREVAILEAGNVVRMPRLVVAKRVAV